MSKANEALDKMAENARQLGLDYEPAQRTWDGLTDEEAQKTFMEHNCTISAALAGILARAIEAKLKEKNT